MYFMLCFCICMCVYNWFIKEEKYFWFVDNLIRNKVFIEICIFYKIFEVNFLEGGYLGYLMLFLYGVK